MKLFRKNPESFGTLIFQIFIYIVSVLCSWRERAFKVIVVGTTTRDQSD